MRGNGGNTEIVDKRGDVGIFRDCLIVSEMSKNKAFLGTWAGAQGWGLFGEDFLLSLVVVMKGEL